MEEIVIPSEPSHRKIRGRAHAVDLEDDDEDELQLPSFGRGAFGNSSSSSLPEMEPHGSGSLGHRAQQSSDSFAFGRHGFNAPAAGAGPASGTPSRPSLSKNHTQPVGVGVPSIPYGHAPGQLGGYEERARLGMLANGSTTSVVTPGTSIGSAPGFLSGRKGSFANLKNAFKAGSKDPSFGVPPVPHASGSGAGSGAGYPALKNPFSHALAHAGPSSPSTSRMGQSPRGRPVMNGSISSTQQGYAYERKGSVGTTHMSQRSAGGRSVASNGSSSFRPDEHPMPALPPIPMRNTPSRLGRGGSGSGSTFHFDTRRNGSGSLGGDEVILGNTPGEEALRMVFKDFRTSADGKIARICGRPLVSVSHSESASRPLMNRIPNLPLRHT